MKAWYCLIYTFSLLVMAHPALASQERLFKECRKLQVALTSIDLAINNISNIKTTRTVSGGPFQPKRIECSKSLNRCEILREKKKYSVYDPDHPDANETGYVTYPLVSQALEWRTLNDSTKTIIELARQGSCGLKLIQLGDVTEVSYSNSKSLNVDRFQFREDGSLYSWQRQPRGFDSKVYWFSASGELRKTPAPRLYSEQLEDVLVRRVPEMLDDPVVENSNESEKTVE